LRVVGVDSGGTFTDVVLVGFSDRVAVAKSPSTPQRPADGVLKAIELAGAEMGLSLGEVLGAADVLAHGTTVGVNALLTGNGAVCGLLTTAGFEDTIPIARINKVHGIEERFERQAIYWEKPPLLLERPAIRGVLERVDSRGEVVVPLDEAQALQQIRALGDRGVEAVGISLLWSFLNDDHEQRLASLVRRELGDVDITLSSELAPRIGEYERSMTVVLNSYVSPVVGRYLRDLEEQLRESGFRGSLMVMRSGGGVQAVDQIVNRPVETLRSGPVGGLGAAATIGRLVGHEQIISTDVGGTSFEVGLLVDGQAQHSRQPMIGRYSLATPVIDIESIGTGGGSIAWIDEFERVLKVGPQSAAALPGPACYGRGGTEPTVTDAAVALGYLERLGGELVLDRAAAERAIEKAVAWPLGIGLIDAAEGILRIASSHMADLVRRMTVQRGHDPRNFVLFAFGGAAPQYVGRYAGDLGVIEVVVPAYASVFSALGAGTGDFRTSVQLDAPRRFPPETEWVREQVETLSARVREQLVTGQGDESIRLDASVALRFARQVHEVWMDLPEGELTDELVASVGPAFEREYERQFGEGTAYTVAGIEIVGIRVQGTIPNPVEIPELPSGTDRAPVGDRVAWFYGEERVCPLFDGERLEPGFVVAGPAFIEVPTTTTVVYPGQNATVDRFGNVFLRLRASALSSDEDWLSTTVDEGRAA
jgi:N-methylhydantoinase A